MSRFRVNVTAKNPKQEDRASPPTEAIVDTGSELTWLPQELLTAIGIQVRRKRSFHTATQQGVERDVGYAVLSVDRFETVDEVVFAQAGDLHLLGVRTLEVAFQRTPLWTGSLL